MTDAEAQRLLRKLRIAVEQPIYRSSLTNEDRRQIALLGEVCWEIIEVLNGPFDEKTREQIKSIVDSGGSLEERANRLRAFLK